LLARQHQSGAAILERKTTPDVVWKAPGVVGKELE
jgi:hypothetical protein